MSFANAHAAPAGHAALRREPKRYLPAVVAVVLFHVLLAYALASGLGRKVVEIVKSPLSVSILEKVEQTPPPPEPPKVVQKRPRVAAPPPPVYAPPVETPVEAPPPVVAVTQVAAPPPPPAPPAPAVAEPAVPPAVNVSVACPNHGSVPVDVPRQALRMGLSGQVVAEFTVAASGAIRDIQVVQSSNALFNRVVTAAIAQYRCIGQGHDVRVRVPFVFRTE